jgi:transposase
LRRRSHDKQDNKQVSPEVRARAVRMFLDHEHEHTSRWATLISIAGKIGCTAQTLHQWGGQAERDSGRKRGLTTDMAAKLEPLRRIVVVNHDVEIREASVVVVSALGSREQSAQRRRTRVAHCRSAWRALWAEPRFGAVNLAGLDLQCKCITSVSVTAQGADSGKDG